MRRGVLVLLVLAAGCTDLPTPAELVRPQVLAVRADPPAVAAGGRSALSVFVAGPEGFIEPDGLSWAIAETDTFDAIGSLEFEADGSAVFVAPAEVAELTLATVEVTVEIDGSPDLLALKGIGVGLETATVNPTVADLKVNNVSVPEGGTIEVEREATVTLDAVSDPPPTQNAVFSWYITDGEIELFRRSPTELIAPNEASEAVLIVVYRDERGGVAVRSATITTP